MYDWPPEAALRVLAQARPVAAARAGRPASPPPALPQALTVFLSANLSQSRMVLPGNPSYEADRVDFNPRFDDRQPGGIVFCGCEADVAMCLQGVQRWSVPFRLRAGRHSLAGLSMIDGGLVIDVSPLARIEMNAAAQEVTVGSGCLLGPLHDAVHAGKLCLPLGGSTVGVAGFMLGGGFAYDSSRTFGMNSDHVVSARVMLADGRIAQASETVNRDLWWALRGGTGGNFGVLLDVCYRLCPERAFTSDKLQWVLGAGDAARAGDLLRILQDEVVRGSEPELNAQADLRFQPVTGAGPREHLRLTIWAGYFGTKERLDALLKPLHAAQAVRVAHHPAIAADRVALPVLRQSRLVNELSPQAWTQLAQDFAAHANTLASVTMEAWGGAIAAYPREKSAFIHREGVFDLYVTAFWQGPDEEAQLRAYLDRWRSAIAPFWTRGVYQNFADADDSQYREHYWGEALPALVAVKRKYDPHGVFSSAQAVDPLPGQPSSPSWPPDVVRALQDPIVAAPLSGCGAP